MMKNFKALVMGMMVMVASTTFGATTAPSTVPTTTQTTVQTQVQTKEQVKVYVTKTGKKFHKANCKSLLKSKTEIELKKAMLTYYEPCKNCHSDVECRELMEQIKQLKEEQKVANKVQPTQPTEQKKTLTIATKPR